MKTNQMIILSGFGRGKMILGLTLALASSPSVQAADTLAGKDCLFPAGLATAQWTQFPAAGFSKPVTGIIYSDPGTVRPISGMPLGALDTGCLDLETSGTFGYSSIFNHLTPRGGPLNSPFLGISVGGTTWVLTTGKTKLYDNGRDPIPAPGPDLALEGVRQARRIDYWGHYPVADLEYETEAPVAVSLRAWAPFLPGDADTSNTPAAVFEVHLSNPSNQEQQGTLAFSFPGFAGHASTMKPGGQGSQYSAMVKDFPAPKIVRQPLADGATGVAVTDENWKMGYALGVIGTLPVRSGGALGGEGAAWAGISRQLPGTTADDAGSSLAVDFKLAAGEQKTVRFLLAWHAPEWKGGGSPQSVGPGFTHMYAARFSNAAAVAQFVGREHAALLRRILAWQEEIYNTPTLPGWLADSLINNFSLIAEDSIWAQAKAPLGDWCKSAEGAFAMNESPRACSQMNTLPNSAIGNLPITYFFPQLDRSYVRQFAALQNEKGDIPCVIGNSAWELGAPRAYGYQLVMNGANYMTLLDRHYTVTGDEEFLKEFYPVAKKTCQFSFNLRPEYGPSQIMAMQPEGVGEKISWLGNSTLTEWFEDRVFHGYQVHAGGFRMAAARMMRRWAETMGDTEYMAELDTLLAAGAKAMEDHLWVGDHYLLYNEPETDKKLDVLFTPVFDGQLYAWQHGLPRVFPKERTDAVLTLFKEKLGAISKFGILPTYASPAGKSWSDNAGYLTGNFNYVNQTVYFIAMTYMYEGQKNYGLEMLRKTLELDFCRRGYTWDGVHVASPKADDGERAYGTDYYMRLALWGVPAAMDGAGIKDAMKPGGLVDRVIRAAKAK